MAFPCGSRTDGFSSTMTVAFMPRMIREGLGGRRAKTRLPPEGYLTEVVKTSSMVRARGQPGELSVFRRLSVQTGWAIPPNATSPE